MTTPLINTLHLSDCDFDRFGTAILPVDDMTPQSDRDAQLHFAGDNLRYYVMRLQRRPAVVGSMTRHLHASQCLGSADAQPWWIAVADGAIAPEHLDVSRVQLVKVMPGEGVKLHPGTWHAGPFFAAKSALFFNLELSDTNLTDHNFQQLATPVKLQLT
jgi:ureidoglycolate hydrolase